MMESDSLWTVAFCVMAFFSVITNVMVLWTVFGHRRMQTNTNIFLVNIAIVDLLMAVLNAVPNFFHMRDRYIHIYFHKPLLLPFRYEGNPKTCLQIATLQPKINRIIIFIPREIPGE